MSQVLGSLGDDIGRKLAEALRYRFADREVIAVAAERFGEGMLDLIHVTEEKPSLVPWPASFSIPSSTMA
jgi:hypothetical protein